MTHLPSSGIEDLYRTVIQDVIEQSKEAFMDENIDTEVLYQIQKAWEEKINASGAADLNPKAPPAPISRPPQVKQQAGSRPGSSASRAPPTMVVPENAIPITSNNSQTISQFSTAADLPQFRNAQGGAIQIQGFQYLPSNVGQFIVGNPSTIAGNLPPNVMMVPLQLTQDQINQLPQNDGEAIFSGFDEAEVSIDMTDGTLTIDVSKEENEQKLQDVAKLLASLAKAKPQKPSKRKVPKIPQVDGGPHMSDSDDSDDDDEDPLSQIVNNISDKADDVEDDPNNDDEPLNSADDQSDDEDLDTLFESSNIIVCQFEKVNRARNKWKFTLKDGIMHLDGKDSCFQKCTGEAEW